MVKYNYILTKGREAVKDNEKQVFTRREIEIDLQNCAKFNIPFMIIIVIILTVFALIFHTFGYESIWNIVLLAMMVSILLVSMGVMIYFIYRSFRTPKYELVTGVYESQYIASKGDKGNILLSFKLYGGYNLSLDNRFSYYKWSDGCCVTGRGIQQAAIPGDEFYLIMVNNKIAYIYSKRMFEFKETM